MLLLGFGIIKTDVVAKCTLGAVWRWPSGRKFNTEVRRFKQLTPCELIPNPDVEDATIWLPSNSGSYMTKSALEALRFACPPEVPWFKLVWDKGYIPRFSFILWVLCKRRLYTKESLMRKWGCLSGSSECLLCGCEDESIDHLFFRCNVSAAVWIKVQGLCSVFRESHPWSEEVLIWLSEHWKESSFICRFRTLVLATIVYYLWSIRNLVLFQSRSVCPMNIVLQIINTIRRIGASWRDVPKSYESWKLIVEWGIPLECFDSM